LLHLFWPAGNLGAVFKPKAPHVDALPVVLILGLARSPWLTPSKFPRSGVSVRSRYAEVADITFPIYLHRHRHQDMALKRLVRAMAADTGAEAFLRQQQAIMDRPDSRPGLLSAPHWFWWAMTIRPPRPNCRVRLPPEFPDRGWS